jgi:hypothetical protein
MAELGPVPPVPVSEIRSDLLGWGTNRKEAEDRYDSVPTLDPSFQLPFIERPQATRLRAGFDDAELDAQMPEPEPVDPVTDGPPAPASELPAAVIGGEQLGIAPADPGLPTADAVRREPATEYAIPNDPIVRPDDSLSQQVEPREFSSDPTAARSSSFAGPTERLFAPSRFEFDVADGFNDLEDGLAMPFGLSEEPVEGGSAAADVARDELGEPQYDAVEGMVGVTGDPYEAWTAYDDPFPAVPRCCRTCREFRPAEGGERGWCTSAWAFQHRRMVHADELPCFSAIGIWWLPSDDLWLGDLDFDHAEPTPLIDALLARRAAADQPPPRERRRGRR